MASVVVADGQQRTHLSGGDEDVEGYAEKLPNTTNGGESSHWLLYRACGQKHDLWDGIRRAYMFQRELEALYMAVIGMSLFFLHKFHKF